MHAMYVQAHEIAQESQRFVDKGRHCHYLARES